MLNIEDKPAFDNRIALFRLGFRPFFLGGAAFTAAAMLYWMGILAIGWPFQLGDISPATWHAHEMIFGYSLAVIAGFLLTAVMNWTGVQTLNGRPLVALFILWVAARLLPLAWVDLPLALYAVIDCLFALLLFAAVLHPVVKSRQRKQISVVTKVFLLLLSNILFYLGALGIVDDGERMGLYSGLYLVLALILLLARRVIPFFIEKGVDYPVQLKNHRWLDLTSLALFTLLWISDAFLDNVTTTGWLAGALLVLHIVRLIGWHTPGIWQKPLLWVLYIAYLWIIFGFALKFALLFTDISPSLAVHAFTVGGIGMMTVGMMARVSLGHTGRNVFEPPKILGWLFAVLLVASVVRVIIPLLTTQHYLLWIGISQFLWIAVFCLFFYIYFPILLRQRVDGRDG
ncbi:MAG TPA: NnrS family protein [Gammaproteobacteria bacterium]|nr:NnrS family protein [Gammaproteobacteria bacterium]